MNEVVKHGGHKPALAAGAKVAAIVPTTFDETYRVAQAIVKSGMAPNSLNTPEKAMVAIMHGMEVGMTPMVALQSIAVINGNPSIWGDGAIGLVRGSGLLEWIEETQEGNGDNAVAICRVKRINDPKLIEGRFSVEQAQKAGLWNKKGPWSQYPDRMLKMRARAFALRDGFADILRGLSIREEVEDYPERQTRSQSSLSERLAAKQQTEPTDEGFNQSSIQEQIDSASEPQEDVMDVEPEEEKQEPTDELQELSDGQLEFLKEIETAFKGCRSIPDLNTETAKFNEDVEAGGKVLFDAAQKLYYSRKAELEQ